jgi:hypothetical protein
MTKFEPHVPHFNKPESRYFGPRPRRALKRCTDTALVFVQSGKEPMKRGVKENAVETRHCRNRKAVFRTLKFAVRFTVVMAEVIHGPPSHADSSAFCQAF